MSFEYNTEKKTKTEQRKKEEFCWKKEEKIGFVQGLGAALSFLLLLFHKSSFNDE